MTLRLALLRAVNVGGHAKVAMADLRDLLTQLGFTDVRSLLQTGNLVFRADGATDAQLERRLEQEAERRLALHDGIGRSRLTSALIEKKLGTRGTGRNWNTVLKLAALADS
jgi:uncharacterized protein (DUF1697 family)